MKAQEDFVERLNYSPAHKSEKIRLRSIQNDIYLSELSFVFGTIRTERCFKQTALKDVGTEQ